MVYDHKINTDWEKHMRSSIDRSPTQTSKLYFVLKRGQKDQIAVEIARQIILEDINYQIAFNIMDLEDPKEIWEKLTSICSEIGQDIVYSIFQELFNYPKINKPKGYDKPVMQIFAEVWYLCKHFQTAMTLRRDL